MSTIDRGRSTLRRVLAPAQAPAGPGWRLHGTAASRRIEAAAAQGLPPYTLMQRAGGAVARLALAVAPHARRIWVLAGRGNNGGDGLEAAAQLASAGKNVTVSLESNRARPPDALAALSRAQAAGVMLCEDTAAPPLQPGDLVLDAVFGLGLSRPPAAWSLEAIRAVNAATVPALAVDLPSGLDGDRGTVHAPDHGVRARWTLSLLSLKPGLFTAAGRDCAGEVWFDDLGTADEAAAQPAVAHLLTKPPPLQGRLHAQHKGSFGDVWIVGGAPGMVGASLLAARAALVAGAGRVHWLALDAAAPGFDIDHPELMTLQREALQLPNALEAATVVCGCGGGDAVRALLPPLLSRAERLLLDADALNALAAGSVLAPLLAARAARGLPTVLTPHPLEAARLLGTTTAAVQADRLAAAQALAERHRAVVALKGSGSVIAASGHTPWINASGNAALATAGSGDVLAGWIGGLWAQGLEPLDAVCRGVHTHGAAADSWSPRQSGAAALEASGLIAELRRAERRH